MLQAGDRQTHWSRSEIRNLELYSRVSQKNTFLSITLTVESMHYGSGSM